MNPLPILMLLLTVATATAAKEKEKEKSTNNPSPIKTLIPQLLPRNPNAKPPPAAVQKKLDAFFSGVQAGKVDDSFRTLVSSNSSLSDPASVQDFVGQIRKGLEVFGPLQGAEVYDQRPVGTRVVYLTYISFHPRKPLRWQFVYYLPVGGDWKLLNLRFDDAVEQSLIPE